MQEENKGEKVQTEAEIYSRSIKTGKVQDFDWTFEEKAWDGKRGRF